MTLHLAMFGSRLLPHVIEILQGHIESENCETAIRRKLLKDYLSRQLEHRGEDRANRYSAADFIRRPPKLTTLSACFGGGRASLWSRISARIDTTTSRSAMQAYLDLERGLVERLACVGTNAFQPIKL
jgi:hypothetical protein